MFERYARLAERALRDEPPRTEECLWLLDGEGVALLPLLHAAFVPRERHFGRKVMVHVLNNVQNGLCPEDCGYCSQSKDVDGGDPEVPDEERGGDPRRGRARRRGGRHALLHGALGPRPEPRDDAPPRRPRAQGEGAPPDRGVPLRRAPRRGARAHPGRGRPRPPEPQPQHQRAPLRRDLQHPRLRRPRRDAARRQEVRHRAVQRSHRRHGRGEPRRASTSRSRCASSRCRASR